MPLEMIILMGEGNEPRAFSAPRAGPRGARSRRATRWGGYHAEGFLERLRLTQVFGEGRALDGWSGERAFPGRGVAVGTQGSRQLGARMAVSGSCTTGASGQRRREDRRGVLGSSRERRSDVHHQRLGSRWGVMQPPSPGLTCVGSREHQSLPSQSGGLSLGSPLRSHVTVAHAPQPRSLSPVQWA